MRESRLNPVGWPVRAVLALSLTCFGFLGNWAPAGAQTYTQDFERVGNNWFQQPPQGANCDGSLAEISTAVAHSGTHAARIAYKFSGLGHVTMASTEWPKVLTEGSKLHFSVWVYGAARPDFTGAGLLLVDAGNETFQYWMADAMNPALAGNDWQQVSLDIDVNKPAGHWGGKNSGQIQLPLKFLGIGLDHHNDQPAQGEVFFDDLSFSGDAPAPNAPAVAAAAWVQSPVVPAQTSAAAAPPVRLTVRPNQDGQYLYSVGDTVQVHVEVKNQAASVNWVALDFNGAELGSGKLTPVDGAADLALPVTRPGMVYLKVTDPGGGATVGTQFAVLRHAASVEAQPGNLPILYGVCTHFQGLAPADADREAALMAALGFRACRFDFSWSTVQPQRDQWSWTIYDHVFDLMHRYRIEPLPVLSYTTRWATTGDPTATDYHQWANQPPVTADFTNFAATAAKRYADTGHYWEVWNEPDVSFWLGDARQYAALFSATETAVKTANPAALVMNGGFSETRRRPEFIPDWQKDVTVKPDIFAYHSHMVFANMLRADDQVRAYYATSGWSMPKWLNEAGFTTSGSLTEADQARALIKKMSFAPALGISGYFWYELRNASDDRSDSEANYGLVNAKFTPKAAAVAVHTLLERLGGQKFLRRLTIPRADGVYALLYGRPDGQGGTVVLWNETGGVVPLVWEVPGHAEAVDMMDAATPLPSAAGCVSLSAAADPCFLTFSGDATKFGAAGRVLDFPSPLVAAPSETVPLAITVHNPLDEPMRGTLKVESPAGWRADKTSQAVAIRASGDAVVTFALTAPNDAASSQNLKLEFDSPDLPAPAQGLVNLRGAVVIPRASAPVLGEVTNAMTPVAVLGRENVVSLYEATPMQELRFHGDADLSARLYLARVPAGLRLSLRVRDDVFCQDEPPGAEWQGDSIQFALALPTGESYEWTAALTHNGPISWLEVAPRGVELGKANLAEAIRREGDETIYDLVIPANLPGAKTLTGRFGFTVLVNDNDGEGRKGWLEWTPGIGRSKDPAQFQSVVVR